MHHASARRPSVLLAVLAGCFAPLAACGGPGASADAEAGTRSETSVPPGPDATAADAVSPPGDAIAPPADGGPPPGDAVAPPDSGPPPGDGGGGGAAYRGTVFFTEHFEDGNLPARGWYDSRMVATSSAEHIPGSTRSFECVYPMGGTTCQVAQPGRHSIPASTSVYMSAWIKYSTNWVGSGRAYHPHEFHFVTDQDSMYVGPAATHLTLYVESPRGYPMLALQDSLNVDPMCITRNDGSFVGCNGNLATYMFTERRSVAACNGIVGDLDGRDCFSTGASSWYSSRSWTSRTQAFSDAPGRYYKSDWHFVEAYFRLNTVAGGVGRPDGAIRYWFDGELMISSDHILFRTGQFPTMQFNQFLSLPYIGDGSPITQTMWVDDLTVAAGTP